MSRRSSKRGVVSARLREHLSVIRACEKSGESLKSYAGRHEVSVHALYQAKKTARKQGLLPPHRAMRPTGSGQRLLGDRDSWKHARQLRCHVCSRRRDHAFSRDRPERAR